MEEIPALKIDKWRDLVKQKKEDSGKTGGERHIHAKKDGQS